LSQQAVRRSTRFAVPLFIGVSLIARAGAAEPSADYRALEGEATRARTWRYAWVGINGAVTVGSFALVPLVDRESRPDFVVSGVGAGITLLTTWIWPLRVETAVEELQGLSPAERARLLPLRYRESAEDERDRVAWPWHVANIGLAAAGGAVIAFGFKHYLSGALTAASGAALGEVQLFTQPTALVDSRRVTRVWRPWLAVVPTGAGERTLRFGVFTTF
jgi:hypothetical protein